jgi:hypothetical protein
MAVSKVAGGGASHAKMDGRFAALARQTHDSWSLIRLERTPSDRTQWSIDFQPFKRFGTNAGVLFVIGYW